MDFCRVAVFLFCEAKKIPLPPLRKRSAAQREEVGRCDFSAKRKIAAGGWSVLEDREAV